MHFAVFDYRHVMQNLCWMWLHFWKWLYMGSLNKQDKAIKWSDDFNEMRGYSFGCCHAWVNTFCLRFLPPRRLVLPLTMLCAKCVGVLNTLGKCSVHWKAILSTFGGCSIHWRVIVIVRRGCSEYIGGYSIEYLVQNNVLWFPPTYKPIPNVISIATHGIMMALQCIEQPSMCSE